MIEALPFVRHEYSRLRFPSEQNIQYLRNPLDGHCGALCTLSGEVEDEGEGEDEDEDGDEDEDDTGSTEGAGFQESEFGFAPV